MLPLCFYYAFNVKLCFHYASVMPQLCFGAILFCDVSLFIRTIVLIPLFLLLGVGLVVGDNNLDADNQKLMTRPLVGIVHEYPQWNVEQHSDHHDPTLYGTIVPACRVQSPGTVHTHTTEEITPHPFG